MFSPFRGMRRCSSPLGNERPQPQISRQKRAPQGPARDPLAAVLGASHPGASAFSYMLIKQRPGKPCTSPAFAFYCFLKNPQFCGRALAPAGNRAHGPKNSLCLRFGYFYCSAIKKPRFHGCARALAGQPSAWPKNSLRLRFGYFFLCANPIFR